ncbi:hypothetical protein TrCOL_g9553 [Triparma columacea]|uniref:Right handed beta helix domain-containing protein n=1 Tax=Triparma columacea TaxID=722753 RepID=A0A9W7G8X9_9STRA|nr:hypothetical protein TrCOL_g9553 [Triparma columacea]
MRISGEDKVPVLSQNLPGVPAFLMSQHTPEEIFAHVLVFVGAHSTVTGIGSATRELRAAVFTSREVWYCLCKLTGKLNVAMLASCNGLANLSHRDLYELYKCNPCVPIDAPTVNAALKRLVRPGVFTSSSPCPCNFRFGASEIAHDCPPPLVSPTVFVLSGIHHITASLEINEVSNGSIVQIIGVRNADGDADEAHSDPPSIIYKTHKPNEPLLRVKKGSVLIQNLSLVHHCRGTDIWEGNSVAVIKGDQSLPATTLDAMMSFSADNPRMFAYDCTFRSTSGRGIVATSSEAFLDNVEVNNCAATGVYIGRGRSPTSTSGALIAIGCDISGNGIGGCQLSDNPPFYEVVQSGHSGIYGQDGKIIAAECSISANSFTGISNTGPRGVISLHNTDIVGNASLGLELPMSENEDEHISIKNCNITDNDIEVIEGGPRGRKRARFDNKFTFNPNGCDPSTFMKRLAQLKEPSSNA